MTQASHTTEDHEIGTTNIVRQELLVPLRMGLDLDPKAELIKELNKNIPSNDYGLPDFIYRIDLLPSSTIWEALEPRSRMQYAENAVMELDYSQGFAMTPTGDVFWSQLVYEGRPEFEAFLHFLNMPRTPTSDDFKPSAPVRQLNLLKPVTGRNASDLLSLSYQYYWPQRAQAFDLYTVASHIKTKELRAEGVENQAYNRASKFISYCEEFLESAFRDPESGMSPKEVADLMVKMMQAQRLSVGLSPNGVTERKGQEAQPAHAGLEVIMRTIAKAQGHEADKGQTQSSITQQLMADPEMLMQAQELIIRMGDIAAPRKQSTGDHFDE
jgi:hypothetical protein